ncbi:MAG TPA: HupE/UreJ family protein [Chromatiales bacterium]|nr:HupE/UreJ family protein [Chromatiales bacterium]
MISSALPLLVLSLLYGVSVQAHPLDEVLIDGNDGGFAAGFYHPVLGWDHFLAMLSVGIVSAQIGGAAIWRVPLTFVSTMAVGGLLGYLALPFLPQEMGIAASVMLLGAFIAFNPHVTGHWAMSFVAFFALFHGYAHGAEIPLQVEPGVYAAGFISGTAIIHLLGVGIGWFMTRRRGLILGLRASGVAIAAAGVWLLVQVLQGSIA